MSDMRPTITASNAKSFAELEQKVNDLPKRIVDQLENVSYSFSAVGVFREKYEFHPTILVLNTTTKIVFHEDEVIIHSLEWTFRYKLKFNGNNHSATHVNFVFIDPNEDKK